MMWGLLPEPVTATTLVKRTLESIDPDAVCLDGSHAAYYVQKPDSLEEAKERIQNGILVDWPGDSMCISYSPLQGHADWNSFDPQKTLGNGDGAARKHGLLTYTEQAYAACAMRVVQSKGNAFGQGSSESWAAEKNSIKPDRKRLVEEEKFLYVSVPSCDGTAFTGDAGEVAVPERLQIPHKAQDGSEVTVEKLHFRGRNVMNAIMQDLASLFLSGEPRVDISDVEGNGEQEKHALMLRNASAEVPGAIKLVMHGVSSGGMALWWLADNMAEQLRGSAPSVPAERFEVLAVSNAGFFLDMPSLHPSATPGAGTGRHVFSDQLKALFGVAVTGAHYPTHLFPKEILKHRGAPKVPFFVAQSKYEESQVSDALFVRCDLTMGPLRPEQRALLSRALTPAQVQQVARVLRPFSKHGSYYKGNACTLEEVQAIQRLWTEQYRPFFVHDSHNFFSYIEPDNSTGAAEVDEGRSSSRKNGFFLTSCVAHTLLGQKEGSGAAWRRGKTVVRTSVEEAISNWVKGDRDQASWLQSDLKKVDVRAGDREAVYCDYEGNTRYA
eukprot:g20654.t1